MNHKLSPLFYALLASGLTACGGGDGGSSKENQAPQEQVSAASAALQTVAGQITDDSANSLSNVEVQIVITDSQGQELIKSIVITDDSGFYQSPIPTENVADAHQVHISVNKERFVNAEKRITLQDGQVSVTSNISLTQVANSISVTREQLNDIAIGASGERVLKLTLLRSSSGKERVAAGDVVAAADEEETLAVNIPVSGISDSVEVVNAELAHFDSSNPQDIQNFPGEFRGYGETESQGQGVNYNRDTVQEDEYRLISSTFSQINLTDQTGSPLPLSETQSASGESTSFTFRVPYGSYNTLERDFDLTVDGIQIPIYVYRSSSGWEYVGNGLLVTDSSGDTAVDSGYINQDGSLALSGYTGSLFVKVEITEANEWVQWINLDWPVLNEVELFDVCFTGNIQYGEKSGFDGYLNIRMPDGGYDWAYINNGVVNYSTSLATATMSKAELLDGSRWSVSAFNSKTYQSEEIPLPAQLNESQCAEIDYSLFEPNQCEVVGTVYEGDGETPVAWRSVRVNHASNRSYTYTDQNGQYQSSIPCDEEIVVTAFDVDESGIATDPNTPLTLDITRENQAPVVTLSRNSRAPIKLDSTEGVVWFVQDPEGEDVEITTSCTPEQTCAVQESGNRRATLSFTAAGDYSFAVLAEDESGNQTQKNIHFEVIPEDNQPPRILGFNLEGEFFELGQTLELIESQNAQLEVIAIDRNGDPLTYSWDGLQCATANCAMDELTTSVLTQPATITVTVTDDEAASDSESLQVLVLADSAPQAQLSLNKSLVGEVDDRNEEAIRVLLSIEDDYTSSEELIVSWRLQDASETDYTSTLSLAENAQNLAFTIGEGTLPVGEFTLSAVITDENIGGTGGQATTVSTTFEISEDLPPSAVITASTQELHATESGANQDLVLTVQASDDYTDRDDLVVQWSMEPAINFTTESNHSIRLAAQELTPGIYQAMVSVTDEKQQSTSVDYQIVVVEDLPPQLREFTVTPATQAQNGQGLNSAAISFTAVTSDDFDQELSFEWSFSPNLPYTSNTETLEIPANTIALGQYQATVIVTDSSGQSDEQTVEFAITEFDGNVGIVIE
ncbi:hypothetical protein BIY21_13275 [Vibrio ponticus]|uniref:PKD domain-containing protein n=1 Tax=Vibrio ponticus TaxID=265668 RepID=A0ABX3FHJ1_9VIBR|nr:hypothetical protein [Vibrio ponticus]OLQ91320.1 hypothetical protein BIY21_13275 [Vibrio ponticus]